MEHLPDPASLPPAFQLAGYIISAIGITIYAIFKYRTAPQPQPPTNDMIISGMSVTDTKPWREMAVHLEVIADNTTTLIKLMERNALETEFQRRLDEAMRQKKESG